MNSALKGLILETEEVKTAIEFGSRKIKEVEGIAKNARDAKRDSPTHTAQSNKSKDPPTPYDQGFFTYDNVVDDSNMHVHNDTVRANYNYQQPFPTSPSRQPPASSHNQTTPNRAYPPSPPTSHPTTNMQPPMYQQSNMASSDPPVEAMQRLEEMNHQAEQVERQVDSAQENLRALAIQYEDLRGQAEQAEILLAGKKPIKKGLFGGKKEAVSCCTLIYI
jgi:hypothetical protein